MFWAELNAKFKQCLKVHEMRKFSKEEGINVLIFMILKVESC